MKFTPSEVRGELRSGTLHQVWCCGTLHMWLYLKMKKKKKTVTNWLLLNSQRNSSTGHWTHLSPSEGIMSLGWKVCFCRLVCSPNCILHGVPQHMVFLHFFSSMKTWVNSCTENCGEAVIFNFYSWGKLPRFSKWWLLFTSFDLNQSRSWRETARQNYEQFRQEVFSYWIDE